MHKPRLSAPRPRSAWLLLALIGLSLPACDRSTPDSAAETGAASPTPVTGGDAPPADGGTLYTCPMHPHIRLHGPGQCPICGMRLEKREAPAAAPVAAADGENAAAAASTEDRRALYYYDPMRPEVHFDKPGRSPFMDMDLVPKYADADPGVGGARVDPAIVQSLGIRTTTPVRREVRPSVRVPARVVADARSQVRLQSRVEGWVERLAVRAVGQPVAAGSVVAEIYAPMLVQAQEELLLGADTAEPARERLRRFGIADRDIDAVLRAGAAARRLPLRAPVGGVVTALDVREGSRIGPETLIVDIASRDAVWIEAQLFPVQRLHLGRRFSAHFRLPGAPGAVWRSTSGTLVPVLDPMTQTLALRFPLADAADLPLGTVLDAEIAGDARADVLLVPVEAVIRSARGDRVVLAQGDQRFVPVPVRLGQRYGDRVEIVEGLDIDDRIVSSGQFLLDAEASLRAGLEQMSAPHDHEAHRAHEAQR